MSAETPSNSQGNPEPSVMGESSEVSGVRRAEPTSFVSGISVVGPRPQPRTLEEATEWALNKARLEDSIDHHRN